MGLVVKDAGEDVFSLVLFACDAVAVAVEAVRIVSGVDIERPPDIGTIKLVIRWSGGGAGVDVELGITSVELVESVEVPALIP
jgi:hypothetical protein